MYGQTGLCLAPCTSQERRDEHDEIVRGLLDWVMGAPTSLDPDGRARRVMRDLALRQRFEEAQEVRVGLDDLWALRRAYAALAEALELCVAVLTPQVASRADGGPRGMQMDLVWRGRLERSLRLEPATASLEIGRALRALPIDGDDTGVADVPQDGLDQILAIRRWVRETPEATAIALPMPAGDRSQAGTDVAAAIDEWRTHLVQEVMRRLGG